MPVKKGEKPNKQEPTIYEIAKISGVSASTVSRVINNYPYVQKETRAKVLKALSDNNYVQNDTARSLVTQASKMVGILIADVRTTHHTEGVYYIEHELSRHGYSSIIYNTGSDPTTQAKYIQTLSQRRVDAVVLMGSVYQNDTVQNAIMVYLPNTPVAICNGYLDGKNIYGVISDEKTGVSDAIRLLVSKGRKHFAFVTNHYTPSNYTKLDGFNLGLKLYAPGAVSIDAASSTGAGRKISGYTSVVIEAGDDVAQIQAATTQLVKSHPYIDAIIFADDFVALAGLHALVEMGMKVPQQVSVIGLNNSRYASISNPALTSIDNMLYDTSLIAVRNLLEVLRGEHVNHKISIGTVIVERSTT